MLTVYCAPSPSPSPGGEVKRLAICCGLLAQPSLLFLDEPTTGLDSLAALTVMRHVRGLADGGATVLAAIHQPRPAIWDLFDQVGGWVQ